MSNCVKSECASWRGSGVQNILISFRLASVSYKEKLLSRGTQDQAVACSTSSSAFYPHWSGQPYRFLGDQLLYAFNKLVCRHGAFCLHLSAEAHVDRACFGFFVPDDQQERNLL